MALPVGVTEDQFAAAIEKFKAAVGAEWVFTEEEDVILYRDAYSPMYGEDSELMASAAVAPATVEEVQEVVRVANELKIPIYPISTGMNLGYGGSAPILNNSVVVDLKRMNKIIEVDDVRHFAIVEPGVSYFDLYRYIVEHDLDVWIDCPDPGWGSIVGNALDHGVGYTWGHYRDHFRSHSGLEAVLPNGELLRTGMGALPGAKTWGEFHYGFGPQVDSLFAQGNAGIVTKMGIHLMPRPATYRSGMVKVPRRNDIKALVRIVNDLEDQGLIGMPRYGSPMSAVRDEGLSALVNAPEGWNGDAIDAWVQDNGHMYWNVLLQFYGPEKTTLANWEYAQEKIAAAIPGAVFEDREFYTMPMTDEQIHNAEHRVALGVPQLEIFSIGARTATNPSPRDGHLWFAAVIPRSGEGVLEAQEVMGKAFRDAGMPPMFGPFSTPSTWMYHTFIFITGFPVVKGNEEVARQNRAGFSRIIEIARQHGYGEYRAPPAFVDEIAGAYNFNDNALLRLNETIKDAIDPNGIIAAGRGGIWPKHLRKS
ncbi:MULTISPECIES: FAD-binding oxidoreductase [unclassified Devosia]|uniref:FAD-binding oxidoreductase n=1 Tax=unclassified Devosia TaxID=196773 RepID=UPI0015FA3CAC|nr:MULTISPECIES: FAD-binding oxidoreductase [unclassified Devosia]MBJ6987841.1 FAD-binding oxidoreductase [Devosia sp. MC521]MBJ7579310.1 FAD-binding oxidoreductase [Devosia sp. MC532]QMW63746.1 FAD-binding oxidoreductase [Devosia sp. MC521]